MSYLFNTFFYNPLYNGLIFLINIIPGGDAGLAVVFLTLIVSFLLFSISKKAIRSQMKLKEPELALIREIKDKQEQAKKTLELYRKNGINPFSMVLLMLIQIPILFALYYVFFKGGLPNIHTELLYSFVRPPSVVSMSFIGLIDISKANIFVAFVAGVTQFIQARLVIPPSLPKTGDKASLSQDFAHSMNSQMKYTFPFIIFLIGTGLPSALPIYWSTRNIFTILQELVLKKRFWKD